MKTCANPDLSFFRLRTAAKLNAKLHFASFVNLLSITARHKPFGCTEDTKVKKLTQQAGLRCEDEVLKIMMTNLNITTFLSLPTSI